jgi:O-antigen/teichoic acid export membrane protein
LQLIKNVSWNLVTAIWMAVILVIVTPIYVSILGFNLYGIIGIWLLFQTVMMFFDFGLGVALMKEFSIVNIDERKGFYYTDILRTIEIVYWCISAICVILFILTANIFLNDWINIKFINITNISTILVLMFISLFFQFPSVLYINGLIGLQRHKLVSILQMVGNTSKFGIGLLVILYDADLVTFFLIQIFVAIVQTFILRFFLWKQISEETFDRPLFNFNIIYKVWHFSKHMALTSLLAVSISNLDRLFVFKLLPVDDFGRYSLAFTATGLLQLAIQPFYRSFFPLFSELFSKNQLQKLERMYLLGNQLVSLLIISLAVICVTFANEIFFVWLGKIDSSTVLVFRFLIVGIMFSGLGWLPAAFQQAVGWPELHVKMILLSIVIAIPVLIFSIPALGLLGASFVWMIHGIIDMTVGLWIMHKSVLKGKLTQFYFEIFTPPFYYALPISLLSFELMPQGLNRINTFIWVSLTSLTIFTLVLLRVRKLIILEKNIKYENF